MSIERFIAVVVLLITAGLLVSVSPRLGEFSWLKGIKGVACR